VAKKYLIDTSAVIKYLNQTFSKQAIQFIDSVIDEQCCISFISEIELQAWNLAVEADLEIYRQFVAASEIIGISKSVIEKTIEVRRSHKLKIADAIIAATVIMNDMTLIADNDKDFLKVEGLLHLNPGSISS
jgi:predicted nucleic acid-binding protein